jgi:hypothetical protein
MKLTKKTNRQISNAVGVLTAIAALALAWGPIFGFSGLAQQIFQAVTSLCAVVNLYFLGINSQKTVSEAEK